MERFILYYVIILATAVTLSFLRGIGVAAVADTCGLVGNSNETQVSAIRDEMFYLDVDHPAPCAGNVTSWTVCYYGPNDVGNNILYWALYAIYRRNVSENGDHYERVSDTFTAVRSGENFLHLRTVDGEIVEGEFNCYNDTIDNGDSSLTVEAGDVLGACIFDPPNGRRQLDIVGEGGEESLLEMNDVVRCTNEGPNREIPLSVEKIQLSPRSSRRLHLYANIDPFPDRETTSSTAVTTATVASPSDNQRLDSGAIAGLTITFLLLLLLGVAGVVVLLLYLVRKRQNVKEKHTTKTVKENRPNATPLDNAIYGLDEAEDKTTLANKTSNLYEVPATTNSAGQGQQSNTEIVYEATETTTSNVYEYATWGPYEMDVGSDVYYSPLDEATISYAKLLEKNKEEDIYSNVDEYLEPATRENELYAQLSAWGIRKIPSSLVQIQGHLGSGQFGSVEKGLWRAGAKGTPVALKLLKEGSSKENKVKFLQEAAIMAQFRHLNVVSLYGVVSNVEPLMLVVELVEKGDLRNYLHQLRPDPGQLPAATLPGLLLRFSQQVALGMQYLSSKGFVHRDLAARNILVSKDNICKVADFGMSRDLADETYYVSQGGVIPVKWTAPEAIHYKKYSTASDVWSYGCLLYEIWSVGYKPFEGSGNAKVVRLVDSGKRLSPPPGCPRLIYELMIKCWNPVAGSRPVFRDILLPLLDKPESVLSIPPEALDTHHLAGVLGSPLEAGENMYTDLRYTYS